jgi:hypothetical protein
MAALGDFSSLPQYGPVGLCDFSYFDSYGYDLEVDIALQQDNARLAHENMLLRAMGEYHRLAHENMVARLQSERHAPPSLLMQSPPGLCMPPSAFHQDEHMLGFGAHWLSEASTTAGSSPPASLRSSRDHSRVASDNGEDGVQATCASFKPKAAERKVCLPDGPLTTVMMRNLPNDYSREMLVELLESEGFMGMFDLLYLPIDFQSSSGLGYAFVNLVTPKIAERFLQRFTGFNNWSMTSEKVCVVTWSDSLQGLSAHIERYRNSPVMHESVPDVFRPLLFNGSQRVPFPGPTKKIRPPRHWHRRH